MPSKVAIASGLPVLALNCLGALDITYILMAGGFMYRTAVVDHACHKVLAHRVAVTLEPTHTKEVIKPA